MNKIHLFALLLFTLSTLSLTGCKDEENMSPRTALLTNGTWTGDGIYAGSLPVTTLLALAGETELAEALNIRTTTFDFDRDGTFRATKAGVTETGKWKFTDNEQKIVISGDNLTLTGGNTDEATLNILVLSEKQFNLEINAAELGYDLSQYGNFNTFQLRLVR